MSATDHPIHFIFGSRVGFRGQRIEWRYIIIDYSNAVYAMSRQTITNSLQRVMNVAARVVSDTSKYDQDWKQHWLNTLSTRGLNICLVWWSTGVCMTGLKTKIYVFHRTLLKQESFSLQGIPLTTTQVRTY